MPQLLAQVAALVSIVLPPAQPVGVSLLVVA
jgi:hypothetical protein